MKVEIVEKKIQMELYDIIRFQITTHCFLNNIRLSPAQMDTLSYLAMWGEMNISDFCEQIVQHEIFTNPQTVRNFIIKCVKDNYVERKGTGSKLIVLSSTFDLVTVGSMVINLKMYHVNKG
jgi:hypothetical protein